MNDADFKELLAVSQATAFEPFAHYDRDGDFIELLATADDYVADRLDGMVTVYRRRGDGEIIGGLIKGISKLTKEARILVRHGKVRLDVLIMVRAVKANPPDPDISVYEQLRDLATDKVHAPEIDLEPVHAQEAECIQHIRI
jgi:hypothetical protein